MQHSDEAKYVLQFINQTNKSVFLTGKAGTGKTTLLKEIIATTHKNAVIVAPTGIAALNAGGVTIHSFFLLPFAAFIPDVKNPPVFTENLKFENRVSLKRHLRINKARKTLFLNLELLIIDEVSMLRADVLDAMDFMLQTIRRNTEPFGGVQVLFIGDLFQLPPVIKAEEWNILKNYYKGGYFFHSHAIQNSPPIYIELDKIFRQSENQFIEILNNLRNNCISKSDIKVLNQFVNPQFDVRKNPGYITLTTHNALADKINTEALESISKKAYGYKAEIIGDFPDKIFPIDEIINLKVGAQVIFIKNDMSFEKNYYNGKMGFISKLSENEIFVTFPDENKMIEVERYEWQNIKYTVNANTKEIEEEILGTFTHYPIKLAWAITVHKSQGLTFDKAVLDVSKVFLPGQAYVALSRLRSLDGLVLLAPIRMNGLENDFDVLNYAENKAEKEQLANQLQLQTKEFLKEYLIKTYSWYGLAMSWRSHVNSYAIESERSSKSKYKVWAEKNLQNIEEILVYSEKFISQLNKLFDEEPYRFEFIKERINKAYQYFFPKMDHLVFELLFTMEQIKKQRKMKFFWEELAELEEGLIKAVLQMKKSQKIIDAIAREEDLSKKNLKLQEINEYKINHLVQIANLLRASRLGLEEEQDDIFEEVSDSKKEKKLKKATTEITLEFWKQQKSIGEIAEIRKLTEGTIYSHLGKLAAQGAIKLSEILPQDKIEALDKLFKEFEDKPLSEIKAHVGELYSWDELKLYQRAQPKVD